MDKKFLLKTLLCTMVVMFLLVAAGYIVVNNHTVTRKNDVKKEIDRTNEVRGVWISFLDLNPLLDVTKSEFEERAGKMLADIKRQGMNTVFLQVRPFADALYPSKYFPWSSYITSSQSSPGYDPLKIMVELAHENQLKIEAWINPYRVSKSSQETSRFKQLKDGNTITKWLQDSKKKNHFIHYSQNGEKYTILNPASKEVIDLIVKGIKEIMDAYAVDGIHFDDYFYPTSHSTSVAQRKRNVNQLIRRVYQTVKEKNKNALFGISPAGVIENCRKVGADVDTWLSASGYIDYICPQIYWSDEYGEDRTKMYENTLTGWQELNQNNTAMYIGLALYKTSEMPFEDKGWTNKQSNMAEQVQKLRRMKCDGFALFSYRFLNRADTKKEMQNLMKVLK